MSETERVDERAMLARLRAGDETAFAALVDALHARLVGLARTFTASPALAEDIAQETWLAVIRGLRGFEGRSSLRTWIFSILVRRARTLAVREARRATPLPASPAPGSNGSGGEWEPGAGRVGLWSDTPVPWGLGDPDALWRSRETLEVVARAVDALPERQRQAVLLRDVEDLDADTVCNILEVSETNLRVLLHRGRARIRRALDLYLREGVRPPVRTSADAPPAGASQAPRSGRHGQGDER